MNTFGDYISRLRNYSKMTQEQLAEKLYVSRTAVYKWESRKGYPNIDECFFRSFLSIIAYINDYMSLWKFYYSK